MLSNLPILTSKDLHLLFMNESKHFLEAMNKGLPYYDLKAIHIHLRLISEEIHNRH